MNSKQRRLLRVLMGEPPVAYVQDEASKQEQLAAAQKKRERKRAKARK